MSLDRLRLVFPEFASVLEATIAEEVSRQLSAREEGWVTTAEAAARTGLSVRAIRHHVKTGRFESRKVGRRLLVKVTGRV